MLRERLSALRVNSKALEATTAITATKALVTAVTTVTLMAAIATTPVASQAAPPSGRTPAADTDAPRMEQDTHEVVEAAIEAWRNGQWTEVRDLLEPLVREGDGIHDPLLREQALRYLAEATLYDEGLVLEDREALARGYIERMLDDSSAWAPPSGLHGRAFYDIAAKVRAERDSHAAEACQGKLLTCEADLAELEADYDAAIERYDQLQADFDAQLVERTQVIQRNRGLALIPGGVGHFTNGRYALGGSFLGLELISGVAGLSLLLVRSAVYGCTRTAGFRPESLVCSVDVPAEEEDAVRDDIERIRNAEAVMGFVFLGAVVVDITLAQVLFKRFEIVSVGEVPRSELTTADPSPRRRRQEPAGSGDDPEAEDGTAPKPDPAARPAPNGPVEPSAKLRMRPSTILLPGPGGLPGGAGLGLRLDF
ncbi:hypothetical protein G6O69_27920 [Pseudenhygromyxa sp. WMMC2535]|uniref:hypothetical protein n=1 Tax=Pseudenhygromyxa sp. WMMC2535 TaxID=2712867 RepID=UPI00155599FF|nr:hypothetical protein [Pseudenhygromyxa sp. WMMC2535]NVB41696.1 hypothetical protein [Pseudenhygromyxa sp. WMMC2535]